MADRAAPAPAPLYSRPPFDPALPCGRGQAILVLPVSGRGDARTASMRAALTQLGYRTFGWSVGVNVGPTPRILAGIEHRLVALHAEHGPLDIAGFSLDGLFARLLAHRHPNKVRQIATICSPFRETLDSAFLPLRPVLRGWRTPDLPRIAAVAAEPLPVPVPVPGTFMFSRNDGIVVRESCVEASQPDNCFEIPGLHVGITHAANVLVILARRFTCDPTG